MISESEQVDYFVDAEWLAHNDNILIESNAIDYFSRSRFYQKDCINERIKNKTMMPR